MNFVRPIRAKFSQDDNFNDFACSICNSVPKLRARAIITSPIKTKKSIIIKWWCTRRCMCICNVHSSSGCYDLRIVAITTYDSSVRDSMTVSLPQCILLPRHFQGVPMNLDIRFRIDLSRNTVYSNVSFSEVPNIFCWRETTNKYRCGHCAPIRDLRRLS